MADPYSDLIAAMIASKGGSDFSSNTMDPIMQYLNGTFQSAPSFTLDQLYERNAPTIASAVSLGAMSPHGVAAARIKAGIPTWQLWNAKDLQPQSGMSPADWKSFINTLADEQQIVKKAMLDQSLQQDVFQKAGMRGATQQWTDMNEDGSLKFGADAMQYAPQQFADLTANLPAQLASDASRRNDISAKYGDVFLTKDVDKKKYLYDKAIRDVMGKEKQHENEQSQRNWFVRLLNSKIQMPGAPAGRAKEQAAKDFLALKGANIKDERLSSENLSRANAINAYADRKQGSGANTQQQAFELAAQILASLQQQGSTPLKSDIMKNAMLKRSTKSG